MLILLMLLSSCVEEGVRENTADVDQSTINKEPPAWLPPQAADDWLSYEPPLLSELPLDPEPIPEVVNVPEVLVIRDTINGISVRVPGQIVIPEEDAQLIEQETEEAYYAISYVSTNSYFGVSFDNDIFSNTDYYYTNGLRFDLIIPIFAGSPFAWPMLPYRKESMNYHGITAVQNMYTPTNPDTISVLEGDRPFAAYLYVGHFKNTLSKKRRYRQYSEIILGLIGPSSLGGFVQGSIHNIEPIGWENQIQNDLVLNYTAIIEKGIVNPSFFDFNIYASGQLGTLYDNLSVGLRMRAGKLNPYFSMPDLANKNSIEHKDALNLQYGITGSAQIKLVAYDATLQGGFFNPNNTYTIPAEDIERFVLQTGMGIYFAYKQLGLTYIHHYISPEHKDAKHHQWGHLNLMYCF